jgi:hypothetical protein
MNEWIKRRDIFYFYINCCKMKIMPDEEEVKFKNNEHSTLFYDKHFQFNHRKILKYYVTCSYCLFWVSHQVYQRDCQSTPQSTAGQWCVGPQCNPPVH